jgi:NAD(P)-dependent dehydrogenase (short-subunit alcohol dehydrogenase family)
MSCSARPTTLPRRHGHDVIHQGLSNTRPGMTVSRGLDLDAAVAVVTGAGSGIGRAVAHAFAARGASVVVTDIDADRAAQVASEIGDASVPFRCDVTSLDEIEAVRDLALERFGRIDVVVNNVGILAVGPAEQIPLDAWQRSIDVNIMGIVRSNSVFLPLLIAQGSGHVVNTASTAGLLPYGFDRLPYTTTKHAIVGMSEALALYLAPLGVGVSCLCPAGVATNIMEQITYYGERHTIRTPSFPEVDADTVGELVASAVSTGRFLVLTADEVRDELRKQAHDLDGYLAELISNSS